MRDDANVGTGEEEIEEKQQGTPAAVHCKKVVARMHTHARTRAHRRSKTVESLRNTVHTCALLCCATCCVFLGARAITGALAVRAHARD